MDRHCLDILTLTFFALCMTSLSSTQGFNDPMYASQAWYLTKSGNESMNIVTAWNAGYTGEGVVVSVVDTGIEKNNDELKANYDQDASYDFVGNITDPIPGAGQTGAHGTRVAGIIAGSANNSKCGVGIAYNVKIGGIKFIDPILSTLGQGVGVAQKKALAFKRNYIDIYTCAWGPDGKIGGSVGYNLSPKVFEDNTKYGRNGKGNIHVFAAGNEGNVIFRDTCTYDGYVTSIYTIAISAVNRDGTISQSMEKCPSISAVVYTRDNIQPEGSGNKMITSDTGNKCYESFSGSSAASAVASGIIALVLQANPSLTWRDVQHIIANTANPEPIKVDNTVTNGAGFKVNNQFGFGLMDAMAMITAAKNWTTVDKQLSCNYEFNQKQVIPGLDKMLEHEFDFNSFESCYVNKLEHVVLTIDLEFYRRKDLQVELKSPFGTTSYMILPRGFRDQNISDSKIVMYPTMTLHNWGERPNGKWKVTFKNAVNSASNGTLNYYKLTLYGTGIEPTAKPNTTPSSSIKLYQDTLLMVTTFILLKILM